MPCSFCGVGGHGIDVCPDRLEERFGTPADYEDPNDEAHRTWDEHYDDDEEDDCRTDGGRDYAGEVHVEDGEEHARVVYPEPYASADRVVVRQRSITQNWRAGNPGWTIWAGEANQCPDDEAKNPDLAPDEVLLKQYGEAAELFRVAEYKLVTDGGRDTSPGAIVRKGRDGKPQWGKRGFPSWMSVFVAPDASGVAAATDSRGRCCDHDHIQVPIPCKNRSNLTRLIRAVDTNTECDLRTDGGERIDDSRSSLELRSDGGLKEVFRRETIQRCECGAVAIGDCDCPEDDDLRADGGQPIAMRYPDGRCQACGEKIHSVIGGSTRCFNCSPGSREEVRRDV